MALSGNGIWTGYFGVPGHRGGMVHLAQHERPMCKTYLREGAEFQWCGQGIITSYLECAKCKRIAEELLFSEFEKKVDALNPRTREGRRQHERLEMWRQQRSPASTPKESK